MDNGSEILEDDPHEPGFLWALVVVGCLAIICATFAGASIMSFGTLMGGIVAIGFLLFGALLITVDFEPVTRVWITMVLVSVVLLASVGHYIDMLSNGHLRLGDASDRNVIFGEVIFGAVTLLCAFYTWRHRATSMVLITLIVALCWVITYAFPWRGEMP